MPPSAITGVPVFRAASTASMIAVSCGTPTPATIRVVQIEPGPMPTLMESAPESISALAPSDGRDIAGDHLHLVGLPLDAVDGVQHMARMAVRGVDHDQIDARRHQPLGAVEALVADGGGGGDAQTSLLVLAGIRIGDRLLDILHGDQADAAILRVDDQQLLDPVLMQQALGLVLTDILAHGDETLMGHQLRHLLRRIGGEAHVAVGQDADELAGLSVARAFHHRDAGDAVLLHQRERVGERGVRCNGQRIDHHAGFELLDLAHLDGLLVRIHVAVDHPDAAGLRHGDRHARLGHGVHGRGHDRDIQGDVAGDARADVDFGRHHVRETRLQQNVVEGQRLTRGAVGLVRSGVCHCHT